MLRIKQQFFLCYAILGSIAPYISVFFSERGLSDKQIGLVMSLGGVSVLLMPAVTALLADLNLPHRTLIRCVCGGSAVALGLILASKGFWWLAGTFWLWAMVMAPVMSLMDGLVFTEKSRLEEQGDTPTPYHHIRVYGTIGFIAPSLALYLLIDPEDSVWPALGCGVVVALLAAGNTFLLPKVRGPLGKPMAATEAPDDHAPVEQGEGWPTMLALKRMLQPDIALFCVSLWLVQLGTSAYYSFYPIYLVRTIEIGPQWVGLISAIGVVLEIGYMLSLGWLLKKLGVKWLAVLGMSGAAVRLLLLAMVPTMWVAIGSQLLHGMTVLVIFVLPPLYLNHRAEPKFRNSIQGLYAMFIFGTGRITGTIMAGLIAEHSAGKILSVFLVTGFISAISAITFALFFRDRSGGKLEP